MTQRFGGNCPANVSKGAKYHVKRENKDWRVELQYINENGERWSPTTEDHQPLVEMVNAVKSAENEAEGGAFYINEYHQVLVPTLKGYFCAGEYYEDLVFEFEDESGKNVELSGKAVDMHGKKLEPGDKWHNPMPGIPYILTANCKDIKYEANVRPKVTKTVRLSTIIDASKAYEVVKRINFNNIFMGAGGRFYINEFGNLFKPVTQDSFIEYFYLGQLHLGGDNCSDSDSWFPKPTFADSPQQTQCRRPDVPVLHRPK